MIAFSVKHVRLILCLIPLLMLSCAGPLRQFYTDTYFIEDGIYENKPLGFTLQFDGNWYIFTDPNEMPRGGKEFARQMQESGGELIFMGSTVEGTQATRGIAMNLNLPEREYAERIHELNKDELEHDGGLIDFFAGDHPMVKWEYRKGGFQFVEFFFRLGTYNLRIAFWTKPSIYKSFSPVYESIMASIQYVSHY